VRVLTLLRSQKGQDRADAVHDAVMLVGDKRVEDALKHILTTKGEAREWAAYAAGVRKDTDLGDALVALLERGTDRERSAAATALARMGDERLIPASISAYGAMKDLKNDILKALGMLGRRKYMQDKNIKAAGKFLADIIQSPATQVKPRQLAIWAAGNFNAPEALLPIEELLHGGADTATMCMGLEALGKIGSASSSPKLVAALYKFNKDAECPEMVYADFAKHEVLICSHINVIERLLHEIAHIGDRSARSDMLKISKDPAFSAAAQGLAAEIAFQMKYKPVEPIPEN
jgi:HEAT repeat protein